MLPKDIMELEVDFLKLRNNQILNPCSMRSEIEKLEKGLLGLFGFQE